MVIQYQNRCLTYPGIVGVAGYGTEPPPVPTGSALYYSDNNIISALDANVAVYKNINVATTAFNYQVVTFQEFGDNGKARDWYINPHGWRARQHQSVGNFKGVRAAGTFTAENANVVTVTQDSEYLRYYSQIHENEWAYFKLVTDQSAKRASAFWNDTYLGYGNVNTVTGVTTVAVKKEQNTTLYRGISARNFKVAGFNNLNDAVNWTAYKV